MDSEKREKRAKRYYIAAAAVALAAVILCVVGSLADPLLLTSGEAPREAAVRLFDAVCQADFDGITASLGGEPELGLDKTPDSDLGVMIRDAFWQSCSYELEGGVRTSADGVVQSVAFTSLDISLLTSQLNERAKTLLARSAGSGVDVDEVYDDNGDYREAFVMGILSEAAAELIAEGGSVSTVTIELKLVLEDGQWRVVADSELLNALSGGTLY